MPRQFTFDEIPESREESLHPPHLIMRFIASGLFDNAAVMANAIALTAPQVLAAGGLLYRQNIEIDPVGWSLYEVTVPYGPDKQGTGEVGWSFSTSGATITVKAAKEHIKSYPDAWDWNPYGGAIGVKGDGEVEGIDIVVPALALTYTFRHPAGHLSEPFAKVIAGATGCTNANEFRTFQPEELLFVGGDGSDGSASEAEMAYYFVAQANVTDLSIGEITGIAKKGHHALWIDFKDEVENGYALRRPRSVHIERVYDAIDFASHFGWS